MMIAFKTIQGDGKSLQRFVFFTSMILTCVIFARSAYACSCMPTNLREDFFGTVYLHNQAIREGKYPSSLALTIVVAKAKEYTQYRQLNYEHAEFGRQLPEAMILTVSEVIQGELNQSELLVIGDNGISCTPYVTRFPIGKSFIFALLKNEDGTYILGSSCRKYFQEVFKK